MSAIVKISDFQRQLTKSTILKIAAAQINLFFLNEVDEDKIYIKIVELDEI